MRHTSRALPVAPRLLAILAVVTIAARCGQPDPELDLATIRPSAAPRLDAITLAAVAATVADTLRPEASPSELAGDDLRKGPGLVYAGLRAGGKKVAAEWGVGASWDEAIRQAVGHAVGAAARDAIGEVDAVELVLAHSFESVEPAQRDALLSNVHRGVRGLEVADAGGVIRFGPTEMLATNRSFSRQLEVLAADRGESEEELLARATLSFFEARQVLVRLRPDPQAVEMFRGNRTVRPADVDRPAVETMVRLMEDWMIRNVQPDGRMLYKYWPSRGRESSANNMIRQWMATRCLIRIARERGAPELVELADRNVRYNLARFYRERDELGVIEYDGTIKLGAMALAALALAEHDRRADYARQEAALRRSIDGMWNDDGSFDTFLLPADREDGQNFYPGEALLYWARLLEEAPDPVRRDRFLASYRYYRKFHLERRNPAFVPWHSQAYSRFARTSGDAAMEDWVLEMNDWLGGMQQRSRVAYDDTAGRFYDPTRPFGPPHASSTGAYMEGLIEAHRIAFRRGDDRRVQRYRAALAGGIRSALQLQFADDLDLFYVAQRGPVLGALRTTVYDNEIRVDSVQHVLLALYDILADEPAAAIFPPP